MIVFSPIHYLDIGGFPVSTHGLLIAAGFLVAELLARRSAKKAGLDPALVDNAALIAVAAGFVGARLIYVLSFGQGMAFSEMLEIWNGGLSSHGGYVFGVSAGLFYVWKKKAGLRAFADAVLPFMLIGWAIGRIGCFLNWDSFGAVASSALSVVVYGEPRLPTQLFESIGYLISFAVVLILPRLRFASSFMGTPGNRAALSLGLFALVRFTVDFFRADPFGYLIVSRVTTVAIIAAALVFLVCRHKERKM
jgi:phosphatidylglycerol---prolipoprotein diacylglyceryl transferase